MIETQSRFLQLKVEIGVLDFETSRNKYYPVTIAFEHDLTSPYTLSEQVSDALLYSKSWGAEQLLHSVHRESNKIINDVKIVQFTEIKTNEMVDHSLKLNVAMYYELYPHFMDQFWPVLHNGAAKAAQGYEGIVFEIDEGQAETDFPVPLDFILNTLKEKAGVYIYFLPVLPAKWEGPEEWQWSYRVVHWQGSFDNGAYQTSTGVVSDFETEYEAKVAAVKAAIEIINQRRLDAVSKDLTEAEE